MTDNWGGPSPYGNASPYGSNQSGYQGGYQGPYQQPTYPSPPPYQGPYQASAPARPYAPPPPAPAAPAHIPEQRGVSGALDDLWSDSPWDDEDDEPVGRTTSTLRPVAQPTHARRAAQAPPAEPEKRRPGAVSATVLILVPLLAALASSGSGLVFTAGALLGAFGAAALCSRRGVWWVATGTPPVVLLMAVAGFVVRDSSASTGKFATSLAKVVAGAFPAMSAALACAVLVGLIRLASALRARKARRSARD